MGLIDPHPESRLDRARPWIGLFAPALAWILLEWGLGTALRGACTAVGAWLGPLWGAASLAACAGAFLLARPMARRAAEESDPPARPWLARVALVAPVVFGLAIALQTLAVLIVPPCVR